MKNNYFYIFAGRIYLQARNSTEAENIVADVDLDDYLINEFLYEVDDDYVSSNLEVRKKQFGTIWHPLEDSEQYERYKLRDCLYSPIFQDFLDGKIDKKELIKQINDTDDDDQIDDCPLFAEVTMVDLISKERKTARLIAVD